MRGSLAGLIFCQPAKQLNHFYATQYTAAASKPAMGENFANNNAVLRNPYNRDQTFVFFYALGEINL